MRNERLNELQAAIKTGRSNINNLSYAGDITLIGRKQRGTKGPLDTGEEGA